LRKRRASRWLFTTAKLSGQRQLGCLIDRTPGVQFRRLIGSAHQFRRYAPLRQGIEERPRGILTGADDDRISSASGMGYMQIQQTLRTALAIQDEADLIAWLEANPEAVGDGYAFSKSLLNLWTHIMGVKLAPLGIG